MSGARVYIGNLPYGVKERDIEHFFRGFGRLREILMKGPYGFVEFEDQRDADDAVYELDGKRIFGERVTVERARGIPRDRGDPYRGSRTSRSRYERSVPPYTRTEHRIIVENLSSRCSWQDLKDYLRKAGEVTYADAHRPYLREGIVEFASYSDMKNAIEKLDDTELYGRRIRLIEDRPKKNRRSSRSRSKSRSASKSRSRSRSRRRSASRSRSRSRSKRSRRRTKSRTKSKSPAEKSKSRSRSESKARSRTKSKSKVRSRTKSPRRTKTRSRSKSKSAVRSSRSKSRARSKTDDRSKSRSRSKSASRSKSRSRSVSRDRSKSRSRSKSRDRSVSRSRSKSRSQSK